MLISDPQRMGAASRAFAPCAKSSSLSPSVETTDRRVRDPSNLRVGRSDDERLERGVSGISSCVTTYALVTGPPSLRPRGTV